MSKIRKSSNGSSTVLPQSSGGGGVGTAIITASALLGAAAKLQLNANAWRDGDLSLCQAKVRNLIEGAFAGLSAGGTEKALGKAVLTAYAGAFCPSQ